MVVKTRKQGNSITITIPSEFNIPSGVKYEAKLLPSGEIIFTPEESGHQISYVSDDAFDLNLDKIFDEYDDVSKLWWKNDSLSDRKANRENQCFSNSTVFT